MPNRDRGFWADIFRKSPLIGALMAVGGVFGFGAGVVVFLPLFHARGGLRLALLLMAGSLCGGIAVGLVIGVIIDSLVGALRNDKKKRRPPDDRYRSW
jgi:hypothetical protein